MSKSKNNYIGLVEDEASIKKKLAIAVTDPARVTRKDPGNPLICNIYSLHTLFSPKKDLDWVVDGCKNAKIGCLDCKGRLFENMNTFLKPIRDKYNTLIESPEKIVSVLEKGAQKANIVANKTLNEVYQAIGFTYGK